MLIRYFKGLCCFCCFLFLCGCMPTEVEEIAVPAAAAPAATAKVAAPSAEPSAQASAPAADAAPEPTKDPREGKASIGFVGDILMMTSQIGAASTGEGYDFTRSFLPLAALIDSVDLMAGNFECTFGGEALGYTQPRSSPPPATEERPTPTAPFQTFSAPDQLAEDLAASGFDLLTTANNHCLDRGEAGLYRTVQVIREAGLLQTGTFLSDADRMAPCLAERNGITVGFVAATESLNSNDAKLSEGARGYAAARLRDDAGIGRDIAACREAGADFVIVCPHWGDEYENRQNSTQEKYVKKLIELGADAIVGSHPHVVQPILWAEGERDGQSVTVPVVYSLGNFISNMSPSPRDYGLFVQLDLERGADGAVRVARVEYLPLLCLKQRISSGGRLHQVLPCYADTAMITAFEPLAPEDVRDIEKCRAHVIEIVGAGAELIEMPPATK